MLRMKSLATAAVVVAAVLGVAAPASADSKTPTGTRIHLFVPPTTFPANTPFYVQHGWGCPTGTGMVGQGFQFGLGTFELYVWTCSVKCMSS